MLTKNTFEEALHQAMREKNEVAKNAYKMMLASIKMMEIDKGLAVDDAVIQSILHKEIKLRRESINEFQKGQRLDLIALAEDEINILQKFLPTQMNDEELKSVVMEAIKEENASLPSDMGKVMKVLIPKLSGKAPADRISAVVRSLLAQ